MQLNAEEEGTCSSHATEAATGTDHITYELNYKILVCS